MATITSNLIAKRVVVHPERSGFEIDETGQALRRRPTDRASWYPTASQILTASRMEVACVAAVTKFAEADAAYGFVLITRAMRACAK